MDGKSPIHLEVAPPIPNTGPFPDPVIPPATHYLCSECSEVFPAEEFVQIRTHPFGKNICKICEKVLVANRVAKKNQSELMGTLALVSQQRKRKPDTDLPTMGEFVGEMVHKFGGKEKLCELLHAQILAITESKPGSKVAIDAMMGLIKFAGETQKIETAERAADRLTEEERMEEIKMLAKRVKIFDAQDSEEVPKIVEGKKVG